MEANREHLRKRRRIGFLALALMLSLTGWALLLSSHSIAQASAYASPADTPTYTSTPTYTPLAGEPEYAVLQYVIDDNPSWTCIGPSGTPGHRYISDCNPFGNFSHPTTGYVDNYGSAGAAQANWQARRNNALGYPIFLDTSVGGYPAYEAGNNNFPFAHYEKYFWGNISVLGAVSSDDTSFRGAPPVVSAIYQAAVDLGYFNIPAFTFTPTATSTPTNTPTNTPTSTPTNTPGPMPTCGPATNYIVTQSSGAAIVPGTTLVAGSNADEALLNVPLPFRYFLYGVRFDSVWADTNGLLQFQYYDGGSSFNHCLPVFGYTYILMPHWDDLDMSAAGCGTDCGIYTSVSGMGPNRVFHIEYRAVRKDMPGEVRFEVRLYEGQNRFDFVYGNVAGNGSGATVGVESMRSAGFTPFSCNSTGLSPGLQLSFQLPECWNNPQMLIGHVTWQGRPAQPDPLQQVPITLTLKAGSDEIDYPVQTTDAHGFFTVSVASVLQAPFYDWRAKGPRYLANSGQVIITDAWYTQVELGLMRVGDANDDNAVNSQDFIILKLTFAKSAGDPGYDDRADFNGDNTVNAPDFALLRANFGQGGAPPIGP